MKKVILLYSLILCFYSSSAFSQDKFWIEFKDKNIESKDYRKYISEKTAENRRKAGLPVFQYSDVPVNTAYLDSLSVYDIPVHAKSKWLNSVSSTLTAEQLEQVKGFSFVDTIYGISSDIKIASTNLDADPASYAIAMEQMNAEAFRNKGLTGKGVDIGVIDAGFYRAYSDKSLLHIMNEEKIVAQRDFIDPSRTDIVTQAATDADYHGAMVLKMIAGYDEKNNFQSGMAINANYYLARTEDGDREHRGEEDQWIQAMEWMDSLGVKLINTSLGYSTKMDDPDDNYKQEEMDGKTARITRAAQIAAMEKGVFLVVSAGNEGNADWRIISAPADAEGVLSVGATKKTVWGRIGYSSIGPDFLPYMKPNVSCFSPNGTSFSAPAITGFVACLMEEAPDMSSQDLKKIVEKSAHLYPYGNNHIGYGVPLADRALTLLESDDHDFGTVSEKFLNGKDKYKIKAKRKYLKDALVFHKSNGHVVVKEKMLKGGNKKKMSEAEEIYIELGLISEDDSKETEGMNERQKRRYERKKKRKANRTKKVMLDKPEGVERSTIVIDNQVIEVFWDQKKNTK
ncbi:S8 family serine peptidase [Cytophagaceae bacterium ABcell3]|nr:S8 family serine peptidase [Cytophagaceae bacterium ABcell3]